MTQIGKSFAAALLLAAFGMQSGAVQAQCSPTNPACQAPQPRTSGTGGSSGGGGVGVQVDVGSAAKAIGGIFKKKKKPVVQQAPATTTPVEQPKQEIIYVRNPPVMQELPRTTPRKVTAAAKPKPQPVVRKPAARKIAAPVAAAAVMAEPMFEPEVAAEPLPEPVPVAEVVVPEVPAATAATITPVEEPAAPANNLYWIIAAAVAALVAAGTAAKFIFTPKVAMDCNIADGTSRMVSDPSLSKPDVTFDVVIPGFSASSPDNLRIVA
jgi:hypothetical protein